MLVKWQLRCIRSDLRLCLLLGGIGLALEFFGLALGLALELLGLGLCFLGVDANGLGGGVLGLNCETCVSLRVLWGRAA